MGRFDYFVGELKCPICGNVSCADSSTNIQTKIRNTPNFRLLSVGCELNADHDSLMDADYYFIQSPQGNILELIDMWECPSCGSPRNWAQITIREGIIINIISVPLTYEILRGANYIIDEGLHSLSAFTGLSFEDLTQGNLLNKIRPYLLDNNSLTNNT